MRLLTVHTDTTSEPHPIFVIILVGPDEQPFGIQKDFLCDRSTYFREQLADARSDETIEHVIKLPETSRETFGLVQQYLYTGAIDLTDATPPPYEALVDIWKLGHKLGVKGLCEKTLDSMTTCRRLTHRIPSTPLLIQVWRDTPEGSSIRLLLLSWAAEYMRSSDSRAEFAKSLPKEVLSELVVAMSSFDTTPVVQAPTTGLASKVTTAGVPQKNVHYLEEQDEDNAQSNMKKSRRSSLPSFSSNAASESKLAQDRKASRSALPKIHKRRSGNALLDSRSFTTEQKLEFCADLLTRMLSGPGFWTRLVGPFKQPVEPEAEGVPDYLEKIKRPMDLGTIKAKMDNREYANEEQFLADVRQIFDNCFMDWTKGDPKWMAGEKLQKTFEEKYSGMNKWISKMGGDEAE
jgi:hypothetical protein